MPIVLGPGRYRKDAGRGFLHFTGSESRIKDMTPEEREKRNAYETARYAALSPAQKQKILDDHAEWKRKRALEDPEQHQAASQRDIERKRDRYHSDPEYREKIKSYQAAAARERRKKAKEAKLAAAGVS